MWTVAQKYIEEGKTRGKAEGIQIGEARGKARGKAKGEARLLNMMIKDGSSTEEMSRKTRLSVTKIKQLITHLSHSERLQKKQPAALNWL